MSFNLNALAIPETTELHLVHPVTQELLYADAAQEKPVAVVLYGQSSKKYRAAVSAMQNRQLKRGKKQVTAEQMQEEGVELLVACSDKAINLELDGKAIDTPESFRKLYSDPAFSWLREQVDGALADVTNFLKV
jgi:hypothetical protein